MIRLIFPVLAAISLFNFYGCSKGSKPSNITPASTQWTLKGTSYSGLVTTYDDTSSSAGILASADAGGDFVTVTFYSHPASNETFTVTNGSSANNNDCLITVGNPNDVYNSSGQNGNTVILTITGGKLKASFTNIAVTNGTNSTIVSGTVIQQ
jgi:hypothetical protein